MLRVAAFDFTVFPQKKMSFVSELVKIDSKIIISLCFKALHTVIVIVHSIRIQVGTSISPNFWNNFNVIFPIYSEYSEYSVFWILQNYESQNTAFVYKTISHSEIVKKSYFVDLDKLKIRLLF